jgi:hypothetical protein
MDRTVSGGYRPAGYHGIANALTKKLEHGSYEAYIHQVSAQRGKALTEQQADMLIAHAETLRN